MEDFEKFKEETLTGIKNGSDESKYTNKRFDQFQDAQNMFNKLVKDNIAKYDTAIENHDDRLQRCNMLLGKKDE